MATYTLLALLFLVLVLFVALYAGLKGPSYQIVAPVVSVTGLLVIMAVGFSRFRAENQKLTRKVKYLNVFSDEKGKCPNEAKSCIARAQEMYPDPKNPDRKKAVQKCNSLSTDCDKRVADACIDFMKNEEVDRGIAEDFERMVRERPKGEVGNFCRNMARPQA